MTAMRSIRRVKVLIIDDSLVFRETIARGVAQDPGIEVVGTAGDVFEARDMIIERSPDVLTLDVEMPGMNGIEFLKKLMPQYPLPVVVVSAVSGNVFDALNAGAVDFVTKPAGGNNTGLPAFLNDLAVKLKIASMARVGHYKKDFYYDSVTARADDSSRNTVIAIGASTGGTEAINRLVGAFPGDMNGIVIVQHMPPVFTRMYAERLNKTCRMEVKEAEDGDRVGPGRALIAPGEYHMKLCRGGDGYYVKCFRGEKVSGHCPSIDVLFDSAAASAGSGAIGILLTGMGSDGAKGLLTMKKQGAYTIGQDEKTCVVYGMPMVAFNIGAVMKQAPLEMIPGIVSDYLAGRLSPYKRKGD